MEKKIQDENVDPSNVNKEEEGHVGNKQPNTNNEVKVNKEETKTETKTDNKEQPKKEETKKEEKVETYKDAIAKVTAKYEKRIADIEQKHAKEIKERDDVIAEMVASEEGNDNNVPTSIKETIAKRRAFKKW